MRMKRMAILMLLMLLPWTMAMGEGDMVLMDENSQVIEEEVSVAREMAFGDEGDDVAELQQKLTDLSYYSGNISGRYREGTRAAIKEFQQDFGLEVTGKADQATQNALFAALYRPLRYGSTGEDVKRLQTRLTELGYYHGKISGNYLEGTKSAVASFQEKHGEESNGEADVDTQTLLYSGAAQSKNVKAEVTATPEPEDFFLVEEDELTGELPPTDPPYEEFTKKLKYESSGKQVKKVQTRLKELGYYEGNISGNFLGHTRNAVKAFQKQNALDVDGVVGEETWNALFNDKDVRGPEDEPKPTPEPTPVPFAITVDVNNQVTTVYGRDENGDYTVVVRQMLCSTGTRSYPSDVGEWTLSGRTARWCYFPKWGGYAQYWTKINSSIAFHSVCYNAVDTMALSVSSYKNLGKRASHGCIRLTVADAKWIYNNVGEGTVVTVTEDLPADPELRASLKVPALNTKNMMPYVTAEPTPEPVYISGAQPPLPLTKLKKNDSSEAVYWMQKKLTELGYYQGKCSGTYLNGTVNAVKAFQKDHGLNVDGVAGIKTLEKLYEQELATPTPEPTPTPTADIIPMPE